MRQACGRSHRKPRRRSDETRSHSCPAPSPRTAACARTGVATEARAARRRHQRQQQRCGREGALRSPLPWPQPAPVRAAAAPPLSHALPLLLLRALVTSTSCRDVCEHVVSTRLLGAHQRRCCCVVPLISGSRISPTASSHIVYTHLLTSAGAFEFQTCTPESSRAAAWREAASRASLWSSATTATLIGSPVLQLASCPSWSVVTAVVVRWLGTGAR